MSRDSETSTSIHAHGAFAPGSAGSRVARSLVAFMDRAVDLLVTALILVTLAYAVYSIWDTNQIYTASEATVYETYKPTEKADSPTFAQLEQINPDVCAWINIYGTGIDYPVVQSDNNDEYMNKTVTGDFALGGSIFLDHTNAKDFSDFNTIIYGHHMEKHEMFGDLDMFEEKKFFDEHQYGSLYYDGRLHGLTVFAMVNADAYDFTLYDPHVEDEASQRKYLAYIEETSKYYRDIGAKSGDHIVMLSTCASGTNERFVLFARVEDKAMPDPYAKPDQKKSVRRTVSALTVHPITQRKLILYLGTAALVLLALLMLSVMRDRRKAGNKSTKSKE